MILKLNKKTIEVFQNNVPDNIHKVDITYEFELGTNHLTPVLEINNKQFIGNNIVIDLDYPHDYINLQVKLIDVHGNIVKLYTGTFIYYKMCIIGDQRFIDIFHELRRLYKENKELKEKGEVI